jgi:uncharacterized radical SAM superfamily protein
LDFGKIVGEYDALRKIKGLRRFSNLILIVLIPTKGTPMENVQLDRQAIIDFFNHTLSTIPPNKVVLGCMRPRDFHEIEEICINKLCKGIVIPSLQTIKKMRDRNIELSRKDMCCVF